MISKYLNATRSITELDELFDRDKQLAAVAASTLFQHEISVAVSSISEIQQVAQARVLADSQIATATVMSEAEVKAAHLLADAQKAKLKAIMRNFDNSSAHDLSGPLSSPDDEVEELRKSTAQHLSNTAKDAILQIEETASNAVMSLKKISDEAIERINALSEDVQKAVADNLQNAKNKLKEEKTIPRTPETVAENAETAASKVLDEAMHASSALQNLTKQTIVELKVVTNEAVNMIRKSTQKARKKLNAMLAKALDFLEEEIKP